MHQRLNDCSVVLRILISLLGRLDYWDRIQISLVRKAWQVNVMAREQSRCTRRRGLTMRKWSYESRAASLHAGVIHDKRRRNEGDQTDANTMYQ